MKHGTSILRFANAWRRSRQGTILVAFAVLLPVMMTAVGFSVDLGQAYLVRQRLHGALDAAALAGAASSEDEATIKQKIEDFFAANYPEGKIGTPRDLQVNVNGDEVHVSVKADFITNFMWLAGVDRMTVATETTVSKAVTGLEVALVLDNTGSMDQDDKDGNRKMDSLIEATELLLDELLPAGQENAGVRVGMVPYANSVRVGQYGIGKTLNGATYDDGNKFVNVPSGISYTTSHGSSSNWYGCVVEHMEDGYDSSATHVTNSKGQLWRTGASCTDNNCAGHGWDPSVTDNDPYPDDISDDFEGQWDIYAYGDLKKTCSQYQCQTYECKTYTCVKSKKGSCTQYQCTEYYSDDAHCDSYYSDFEHCAAGATVTYSRTGSSPNSGCPYANIIPLTNDRSLLLQNVNMMKPEGNTLSNVGLLWGYKLLSPDPPFTEGSPFKDEYWKKALVIMSDGVNTRDNNYSYFWFSDGHQLNTETYNERFTEICEELKEQKVMIFTILLTTGGAGAPDEDTVELFKSCATDGNAYTADEKEKLKTIFKNIGGQLASLHISK